MSAQTSLPAVPEVQASAPSSNGAPSVGVAAVPVGDGGSLQSQQPPVSTSSNAGERSKETGKGGRKRCARCGRKWHKSWRCATTVRECARCSNPGNTQQCHTVVMRTRLMKGYRDRGQVKELQSTLASLKKDGHRPTVESYTLLVSGLVTKGRMQEAQAVLQQMDDDEVLPDAIWFNTLLNGWCEVGKMKEAQSVLLQMKDRGCAPTSSTYNTLIKGYGLAGQPRDAMKVLQDMGKGQDTKPTRRTFNMLINVWTKEKNPEEGRWVMSLMRAAKVAPDVVSYNTLAQAYAQLARPWEAERVIAEMQNAYLRPNERTYGIVISGFIKDGKIEHALPLIDRMRNEGIPPNLAVFNILIKGYAEALQADGIDKVLALMTRHRVKPDVQTFGLIMNAWSEAGFIDEAKATLQRMREFELQPDVTAYSILAKGYARGGRPAEGELLLQEMIDQGLTPNVVILTTVISGYCSLAQMDDAMRVYNGMELKGISPNMNTFHTLLWGFTEARLPRQAEELLEQMKKAGVRPDKKCLESVAECWSSVGLKGVGERILATKVDLPDRNLNSGDKLQPLRPENTQQDFVFGANNVLEGHGDIESGNGSSQGSVSSQLPHPSLIFKPSVASARGFSVARGFSRGGNSKLSARTILPWGTCLGCCFRNFPTSGLDKELRGAFKGRWGATKHVAYRLWDFNVSVGSDISLYHGKLGWHNISSGHGQRFSGSRLKEGRQQHWEHFSVGILGWGSLKFARDRFVPKRELHLSALKISEDYNRRVSGIKMILPRVKLRSMEVASCCNVITNVICHL